METLTTLKTRRSCRAYKADHIEEEKLNAIVEAGTYAPTGMGKQSPIILVIKDKKSATSLQRSTPPFLALISILSMVHRMS